MLENFKKHFQPGADCIPASEETIEKYKNKVPESLIEIWKTSGFGKYNDGLIEFVNPADFEDNLWTWLGREVPNYVPFAISGFGELFYYRKLTDEEEDVCMIDIQYRKIETLVWSMDDFLDDFITNVVERKMWLREDLFEEAITQNGKLEKHEVFTFAPILAFGGGEEMEYLQKGNAQVYQDLVFQMTS
ncbi:T6SS immunity protein Tdi1 domain-containing protein [Fluviicola taffensis]|uniref:T6SS immunity protein Tdi1 domain-containing protein n=1 Tax=Fluviicola taffensis TaxID=191579 RepID=UPI003137AF40